MRDACAPARACPAATRPPRRTDARRQRPCQMDLGGPTRPIRPTYSTYSTWSSEGNIRKRRESRTRGGALLPLPLEHRQVPDWTSCGEREGGSCVDAKRPQPPRANGIRPRARPSARPMCPKQSPRRSKRAEVTRAIAPRHAVPRHAMPCLSRAQRGADDRHHHHNSRAAWLRRCCCTSSSSNCSCPWRCCRGASAGGGRAPLRRRRRERTRRTRRAARGRCRSTASGGSSRLARASDGCGWDLSSRRSHQRDADGDGDERGGGGAVPALASPGQPPREGEGEGGGSRKSPRRAAGGCSQWGAGGWDRRVRLGGGGGGAYPTRRPRTEPSL